jgi:hypothetical protein
MYFRTPHRRRWAAFKKGHLKALRFGMNTLFGLDPKYYNAPLLIKAL